MSDEKKVIAIGSEVVMHFTLRLTDNSVAETTKKGEPSRFTVTEDSIKDPVESAMIGHKAGDKVRVELSPEQGYGHPNPGSIQAFPREKFPEKFEPQVGDVFSFEQPNGDELPGVIKAVGDKEITVDFNHPLAGQVILFEAEILEVVGAV